LEGPEKLGPLGVGVGCEVFSMGEDWDSKEVVAKAVPILRNSGFFNS